MKRAICRHVLPSSQSNRGPSFLHTYPAPPDQGPSISPWRAFLRSRRAALLTHASLAALTLGLFLLLLWSRRWWVLVPGALIQHRIGVLLHEYIHCIPLPRRRHNQIVLSLFEGLMVSWGMLELFRATHLAHHRWLNSERDPAFQSVRRTRGPLGGLLALELAQHARYLLETLRGRRPDVHRGRILLGAGLSLAVLAIFWMAGRPDVPLRVWLLAVYNALVSSSLRGAVEHHSHPGDGGFANEYRSFLPAFNINRHIHHHLDPRCPWYLLAFVTAAPLPARSFMTHWVDAYLRRRKVLMQPMR